MTPSVRRSPLERTAPVLVATLDGRDRGRFSRPASPQTTISRRRLDGAYADATGAVLRVLAPGGYGKSTLLARWVAEDTRHSAWIELEPIDNDPAVLAAALARALAPFGGSVLEDLPTAPARSRPFTQRVVPTLGSAVRAIPEPFVLVLDDLHEITDPSAGALIDAVAENLPPDSTLVLCGRAHRVDRSIGRLRLVPGVTDLLAHDLALRVEESAELIEALGLDIDDADRDELIERFGGWPAGLRLASLVLRSGGEPIAPGPTRLSDATYVTDYLRSEWTAAIPPDDVEFLRGVACLDRFTGEMCDAVLGTAGSAARLRRLQHTEQLVLPLDQHDEWFGIHAVLAHWLEAELRETDPGRWRDVHSKSAAWWRAKGDIDLALGHSSRIGDTEACAELIEQFGGLYLTSGLHDTVERWLSLLPADRVQSSPALCSLATTQALQAGDGERAHVWHERLIRSVTAAGAAGEPSAQTLGMAELFRATLERGSAAELSECAQRATELLAPGPWRSMALWVMGTQLFMAGDEQARAVLDDASTAALLDTGLQFQLNSLATSAIVGDLLGGDVRHRYDADRAREMMRASRSTFAPTTAPVTAMNALSAARSGRRELAIEEMHVTRDQLHGYGSIGAWFNVLTRLALVRTALVVGDHSTGRTVLREAESFLRPGSAPGAEAQVSALRTSIEQAGRRAEGSVEPLTAAELRVMAFLPTNLSLADIATQLFVSRNTVKTHAAAIYRKFGTTSRGDAVELARQAGILDQLERPTS